MSATVRLNNGNAIQFDEVKGVAQREVSGVLLSLEGKYQGEILNCLLIPLDRIETVIESLRLVASQVRT